MYSELFRSYASAFTAMDVKAIASFYDFPMTFYSETGESLPFDEDTFNRNSESLVDLYKDFQIATVDFELESQTNVSDVLELVSVIWHFKKVSGELVYSAVTRYLVGVSNGLLKIKAVFVIDESAKIQQLKLSLQA
ncbi:hypothetical protein FLL45_00615 [Aliikangiella marina]|uniref:Nuclear transport factor 2 family protein n=1 Tax=Aliikangiella marina TaxID=1712262 RepID=A0A545TH26_9GAMM|nr:hypothetical protein [Aliikangiella marina]TQV76498.1 hypothetical protein FLL45_00615 [Aliikangiella marina]